MWTGTEMIIWGGALGGTQLNTGGRYNPTTNSWSTLSTVNAPSGRVLQSAVWTGTEMIIWGGNSNGISNTGARYNPATDTWTTMTLTNPPSARDSQAAAWTGTEMIVWGGFGPSLLNSGGRYNPATDTWTPTSTVNAPVARAGHAVVWTGTELIVWGGFGGSYVNTGGRYNPVTDSWIATSTTNAPAGRELFKAFWTGSEMILWGGTNLSGDLNSGSRYNPSTDSWIATCHTNAPTARLYFSGVWTGSELIVWGGDDTTFHRLNSGGRYAVVQGPIQLALEQSGQIPGLAAALDSMLTTRDAFPIVNGDNVLNPGPDRNTRVSLFVSNLLLPSGSPSSSIVIHLIDSSNQSYDIAAEDARVLPGFVQVTFRLPSNLPAGNCSITIKANGQTSNAGIIRIKA